MDHSDIPSGPRVIALGCGRTGTSSLKEALTQLGFGPTYHMKEVIKNNHTQTWIDYFNGSKELTDILYGYGSCADFPVVAVWRELYALYPDAKFILTTRNAERWQQSCYDSFVPGDRIRSSMWWAHLFHLSFSRMQKMCDLMIQNWEANIKDVDSEAGLYSNAEYAIDCFHRHNQAVQQTIPANQLLVYSVKEGWGPLCKFLEVGVPDTKFPHRNTSDEFEIRNAKMSKIHARVNATVFFVVLLLAVLIPFVYNNHRTVGALFGQ